MMILLMLLGVAISPQEVSPSIRDPAQVKAAIGDTPTTEEKKSRWLAGTSNFRDLVESMGSAPLLKIPAIRSELKLTDVQKEKLDALLLACDTEYRARNRQILGPLLAAQRKAKKDGTFFESPMVPILDRYRADTSTDVKGVLNPGQYRRYLEIQIQLLGPVSLLDPELQDRLNLSPDTKANVADVHAKYRRERLTLLRSMSQAHLAAWKKVSLQPGASATPWLDAKTERMLDESAIKMELLETRVNGAILRHLTKRQRETFRKMAGEPFSLKELTAPGAGNAFLPGANPSAARPESVKAATKAETAPKQK